MTSLSSKGSSCSWTIRMRCFLLHFLLPPFVFFFFFPHISRYVCGWCVFVTKNCWFACLVCHPQLPHLRPPSGESFRVLDLLHSALLAGAVGLPPPGAGAAGDPVLGDGNVVLLAGGEAEVALESTAALSRLEVGRLHGHVGRHHSAGYGKSGLLFFYYYDFLIYNSGWFSVLFVKV